MWRIMVGLAAWTAGTVIAVSVAWFGANVVVRNAGVGPGIPVVNASVLPPSAAFSSAAPPSPPPAPTASPAGTSPAHPPAGETPASASPTGPSASASASATPSAGNVRAYTLAGGHVTLEITNGAVQLVTAVPDAGYSVQTWSGTGWLRVDFSSGPQVSSLIASWYQHAPTITVTN
jgi:hypothetical protein